MIDLRTLKEDDCVIFRCGGKAIVDEVVVGEEEFYPIKVRIRNYHIKNEYWVYDVFGELGDGTGQDNKCPFDIIHIEHD